MITTSQFLARACGALFDALSITFSATMQVVFAGILVANVGWKYAALVTTCAALVTLFVIGRNLHYRVLCASRNFGRAVERIWKS